MLMVYQTDLLGAQETDPLDAQEAYHLLGTYGIGLLDPHQAYLLETQEIVQM